MLREAVIATMVAAVTGSSDDSQPGNVSEFRYKILNMDYHHVAVIYNIILWVFLTMIAKIGFHSFKRISSKVPESCSMIVLGLILGLALKLLKFAPASVYSFNSNYESRLGVSKARDRLTNGFNFAHVYGESHFELLHCLVFAALISAVDPVAVLATFEDIHVNDTLYIIVFGESLLNDAVSVVLYRMLSEFALIGQSNIIAQDIIFGIISFFAVSLGGVLVGIVFGAVGSFITKFMEVVPILEPLMVIISAYLSYLTAEMLGVSGIIAITVTGMILRQYIRYNLSEKSCITTEYVIKMMSSLTESIIFLFMGLSVVNSPHSWNTGFVIVTTISCLIYRAIGVVALASLANVYRLIRISFIDMVVMCYGGLRGAVAFALAMILKQAVFPDKSKFLTTTVIVVYFTVFVQGATIGPIVKLLKVRRKQAEEPSLSAKLTNRMIDHVMALMGAFAETTIGFNAQLLDKIRKFDLAYLKPIFLRTKFDEEQDIVFLTTIEKIGGIKADGKLTIFEPSKENEYDEDSGGLIPDRQTSTRFNVSKYESDKRTRKVHKVLDRFLLAPRANIQRRIDNVESRRYSLSSSTGAQPHSGPGAIYNRRTPSHSTWGPEMIDPSLSLTSGAGYRYHQYQPYYRRVSRPFLKREIDEMPTIQRTEAEKYKPWKKSLSGDDPPPQIFSQSAPSTETIQLRELRRPKDDKNEDDKEEM
ncbi:hypothetical protein ACOME3_000933 [Neoechinorhynchus agilis]